MKVAVAGAGEVEAPQFGVTAAVGVLHRGVLADHAAAERDRCALVTRADAAREDDFVSSSSAAERTSRYGDRVQSGKH